MGLFRSHFIAAFFAALAGVASGNRPASWGVDSARSAKDESGWVMNYLEPSYLKECYNGRIYKSLKTCTKAAKQVCIEKYKSECKKFTQVTIRRKDPDTRDRYKYGCSLEVNETGNYLFLNKWNKQPENADMAWTNRLVCGVDIEADTQAVVELINGVRSKNKLPNVTACSRLSRAAWKHAKDMAVRDYLSSTATHVPPYNPAPNGVKLKERLETESFKAKFAAENLFDGESKLKLVFRSWMKNKENPQYADNIKSDEVSRVGIGVYRYRRGRGIDVRWSLVLADEK